MSTKLFLNLIGILSFCQALHSQNTGIGVANPAYSLDVNGSFRIENTSNTAGVWFDGSTLPTRSFIGSYNENHFGFYGSAGAGWNFLINQNNNNVGIGVLAPSFRMDINGRMRIQQSANTAGIWFDGTTMSTRSFIGTMNDNHMGFYGSGGTGWNFVMNTTNGNFGIGTTSPTKSLDINGTLRIRSNTPVKGSMLTSTDSNGNAEWANPVSFRGESTINNEYFIIPSSTWTKVLFNQSPVYNYGNNYQPGTSTFIAAANGIYNFNASISFWGFACRTHSLRFILDRGGNLSTIAEYYNKGVSRSNTPGYFRENAKLSSEVNLLAGDKVWVEYFINTYSGNPDKILNSVSSTYFSGELITKI